MLELKGKSYNAPNAYLLQVLGTDRPDEFYREERPTSNPKYCISYAEYEGQTFSFEVCAYEKHLKKKPLPSILLDAPYFYDKQNKHYTFYLAYGVAIDHKAFSKKLFNHFLKHFQ